MRRLRAYLKGTKEKGTNMPPPYITPEPVAPGEESVWDYPRPPRLEDTPKHIEVYFNGEKIADTRRGKRVLETSHPPTYYIPLDDLHLEFFTSTSRSSYCEYKGRARYYTITVSDKSAPNAAWQYPEPPPEYGELAGFLAMYAGPMDMCLVDGEAVTPQPGDFYGGWITREIKGPFKGTPGTMGW